MKCPKCLYIGFETGDRCKNCGYDFSLLAMAGDVADAEELPLRQAEPVLSGVALELSPAVDAPWTGPAIDRFRDLPEQAEPAMTLAGASIVREPVVAAPEPPPAAAIETPALPLFSPDVADDEPLVKLPASPRPPLSVRRTPDTPRLRLTAAVDPPLPKEAVLQFAEDSEDDVVPEDDDRLFGVVSAAEPFQMRAAPRIAPRAVTSDAASDASPLGKRVAAAIIDHGILLGIDLVVLYFTLRLTGLTFADWQVLPWLPLAAFLLSVKVAYLSAFTTAGGQTIGKMATHIRVVSEDGGRLDPGQALRRAVLGLVSIATAGTPFLTAIADPLRRGVHDRASGTRVVAISSR